MTTSFAHLDPGGISDQGRCRQENEDAISLLAEAGIFCVSDGVGGHANGEIASQAVVEGLQQEQAAFVAEPAFEARCDRLRESLQKTNAWVLDQATLQGAKGMGATVVVLAFDPECPGQALVMHAGDSRGYRFRAGRLTPLTIDHNMGNYLGPKSAEVSAKLAGTLTHAVGISKTLDLSEMKVTVEANDLFLLCTDGLTKMLPDRQITKLLRDSATLPAAQVAQKLVDAANEAGGKDNVSAIVLKVAAELPAAAVAKPPVLEELQASPAAKNAGRPNSVYVDPRRQRLRMVAAAAGILLLVLVLGWLLRMRTEAIDNRLGFENEMAEAKAAFDRQDYDEAQFQTQAAAARFAAGSPQGLQVRELQEKIAADQFDRSRQFATAMALATAAQAKGDLATAQTQAKAAQDLFSQNRPESRQAQVQLDQLGDAAQKQLLQQKADCEDAIEKAKAALERQDYAGARDAAASAATLCADGSPEAETAKTLLAQAETGLQQQRQQFTAALAVLDAALAKNDFAGGRQQAIIATDLCQPGSVEATRLREAIDRIAAAQKREDERQQELLAAAQAEKTGRQINEALAIINKEKPIIQIAEPPVKPLSPIDQAKFLIEQQNYAEARKVIEPLSAKAAPGTPEAETAKSLLAQIEAGEQLMQRSMRFEAVLAVTRTALTQKDLVTAKKQADLAIAIFPPGTPEWQQAQALSSHLSKTTPGPATPPAVVIPPAPAVQTPLPSAPSFGLVGLFKGKAGIPDLTNKPCYLRVNLWDDPATRITTTNYHRGTMLPAGTQVRITRVTPREIAFTCKATGTQYTILPSRHVRESLQALQHRYFTEQDPLPTEIYQRFTQTEKDAIRDGKIFKGMSKEAVLMAYGYPPSHKTISLELNAWFYWIDTRNFEADFQNGKVTELKEHPEGLPLW